MFVGARSEGLIERNIARGVRNTSEVLTDPIFLLLSYRVPAEFGVGLWARAKLGPGR